MKNKFTSINIIEQESEKGKGVIIEEIKTNLDKILSKLDSILSK